MKGRRVIFMDKNREYFIIENHSIIKKVRIIKFIGGFYTINIEGTSKYLRVHPSRIYSTYTDASGAAVSGKNNFGTERMKNGQLL